MQHSIINDQLARTVREAVNIHNTQADDFDIGHIELDQEAKTLEHNHPAK